MSKTFVYTLLVIAVYVAIIFPKLSKANKTYKNDSEKEEKTSTSEDKPLAEKDVDENGISRGASGQMKYRIGYTN